MGGVRNWAFDRDEVVEDQGLFWQKAKSREFGALLHAS
jgi:hypothetical protein